MKLPNYVKSKKYIGFLPLIGNSTANSIYPFVFLPDKIYRNLTSDNPNPHYLALLGHEQTHRKRQREIGFMRFILKYLSSNRFRLNEELIADKTSILILKKHKLQFDTEKRARHLSSYVYFWMTDYNTALGELRKLL